MTGVIHPIVPPHTTIVKHQTINSKQPGDSRNNHVVHKQNGKAQQRYPLDQQQRNTISEKQGKMNDEDALSKEMKIEQEMKINQNCKIEEADGTNTKHGDLAEQGNRKIDPPSYRKLFPKNGEGEKIDTNSYIERTCSREKKGNSENHSASSENNSASSENHFLEVRSLSQEIT
jgi:hypothetical protein